jgi:serine/threonine protein kinase
MGVVYLAEDTRLERKVAIKFLPRQIAASQEDRQRFEIEAKAAGGAESSEYCSGTRGNNYTSYFNSIQRPDITGINLY